MSAASANLLSDSQLRTNAFFDPASQLGSYFPFTADLALLTTNGSAYAQTNRNRILSDAIPARTLPVGANPVGRLALPGNDHNFNMQTAFENGWPASRSVGSEAFRWHHSDFRQVAYPFTHAFFDKLVEVGGLK